MSSAHIDPTQFVELVQPLLEGQNLTGLLTLLETRWTPEQLRNLLRSEHTDAKKVALLALALVGPPCCIEELAVQLKDPDAVVNQMAEHALWSVWFRSSKDPQANVRLARGAQMMNERDLKQAIEQFSHALQLDPDFAEAYNQRAIAYYLLEMYEPSIGDCRRTVRRMPCHFGAWAGMGHGYAHLGKLRDAITAYETALEINPHLHCIREALGELHKRTDGQ